MTAPPCLAARGISKSYGATRALDGVDFAVAHGEIHALLGENGAGKSTLVKILSGIVRPDAGSIELDGRAIEPSPRLTHRLGIVVVHQELSLLPNLSVAENILISDIPLRRRGAAIGLVDRRRLLARARESLAAMALDLDPAAPVASLSQAERQLVEIARAQAQSPKVILFDEPTSSLPPDQRGALFGRIRRIREAGVGVVFITHFLEEALALSDRITVLRDGKAVSTLAARETTVDTLVELMSGRPAGSVFPRRAEAALGAVPKLQVSGIAAGGRLHDVSFSVGRGEVVGLAGLVGSGRTETLKAIFGVTPIERGSIAIDGRNVAFRAPAEAITHGIAFIPEDRQDESIFANDDIANNICVAAASTGRDPGLRRGGFVLRGGAMARLAERLRGELQIKAASIRAPITSLSGGNQQKTILARWMATRPQIVLADEPTRGVSIGSKIEIYKLIRQMAADGAAVVIASSEFEELVGLCNRVYILRDGRTAGETAVTDLTADDLLHIVLAKAS
ncbi:MAG: sugar ABC transporter ATP-binding protein [Dongiaceae bacterium]